MIEHIRIPFADLVFLDDNPRTRTPEGLQRMADDIRADPTFFDNRPVLVNLTEGRHQVYAGDLRAHAAHDVLGWPDIPCNIERDLTPDTMRARAIKDNLHRETWAPDILKTSWASDPLDAWGLPPDAWGDAADTDTPGGGYTAQEDDYTPPPEIHTDIMPGDLITIGPHRLLCGDSTNADDVAKVMDGEKADLVFTDPPYGVSVVGTKNNKSIAGDLSQTVIPFSFELAVNEASKEDARFYFCGAEVNILMYQKLFDKYLKQLPRHIIWVKNGFVMKPNNYHNQYEIIYFGYKPRGGGLDHWFGGRTEHEASDVWRINRDNGADYLHPTQKPVELPSRAIKNSSPEAGLVFEPFGGSGSTLVAAHQLHRRCYGLEIDPKYCQVIIDRMHKLDPALPIAINGKPYTPPE